MPRRPIQTPVTRLNLQFAFILCTLILTACSGGPVREPSPGVALPPGTLGRAEVAALFGARTVTSITLAKERVSTTWYRRDGLLQRRQGKKVAQGSWRVNDRGRLCTQIGDGRERCRAVARTSSGYVSYVIRKDGDHRATARFVAFRDGNALEAR